MRFRVHSKRKLLLVDFSGAFAGAVFFLFAFDFLVGFLPKAVVQTQLTANLTYGLVGLALFLSHTEQLKFYLTLMWMNFAYAGLCILGSAWMLMSGEPLGCLFLLVEAAIIAALATVEKNSWCS